MNTLFAVAWLVIIGTNAAQQYSVTMPFQALITLAGAGYVLLVFRTQLLRLLHCADFLLVAGVLVVPVLLMLASDRTFERTEYMSQIAVSLIFVVASVLASRTELSRVLAIAAFAIVLITVTLNLYELFVRNNVWSTAPGRSAGFYTNPNLSAEAILGYGLMFLLTRSKSKLDLVNLIVLPLVLTGVFATFSRAGILASLVLLPFAMALRGGGKQVARILFAGVAVASLAYGFGSYVVDNLNLSEDAQARVLSLVEEGGVGDYREDRGLTALAGLKLGMENPLTGSGVRSIYKMEAEPHNMFVAMFVDYGIIGLLAYLLIIVRLVFAARGGDPIHSGPVMGIVGWLLIFSFSSHNLLDSAATMPLLAFAVGRACHARSSTLPRRMGNAFRHR
jgi:hypothetical protein